MMRTETGSWLKPIAIAVVISVLISVGSQALLAWRNDSVQEEKISQHSQDIQQLKDKKADVGEYRAIQQRLDSIDRRLESMEKRIDNISDKRH